MKAAEAVAKAAVWWDQRARHILKREFNTVRKKPVVRTAGAGPAFIVKGEQAPVYPSGILNGLPFDALDRREKLQVVKWWHHWFVSHPAGLSGNLSEEDQGTIKRLGLMQ